MKALALLMLCFLAVFADPVPLKREKRAAVAMAGGWPFGVGVGTGVFQGFPGFSSPFAGGFPGFSSPFASPWDYSRAFMPIMPVFTFPKPWYEGDNVCTTTKEVQDPQELQEWFTEVSSPNLDYNHESQQCQGNGAKYVCFKRYVSNGESKMKVTKYECCHGFVRNPNGPGCMENNPVPQAQNGGRVQDYYYFPQQQQFGRQQQLQQQPGRQQPPPVQPPVQQASSSMSTSTSASKTGVESVAAQ